MLRITIELVPNGKEELARGIGGMLIINDGTGTPESGNYIYSITSDSKQIDGTIKRFERKKSVWNLVSAILKKIDLSQFDYKEES
jgi:hypothetical protein